MRRHVDGRRRAVAGGVSVSFPFASYFDSRNSIARPVLAVVYATLVKVLYSANAPMHKPFSAYVIGCSEQLRKTFG